MSNSPWGAIQYSRSLIRGVRSVSTASHGGIMVTKKFGDKNFSKMALEKAIIYSDYYCYEEDCDYAVAMFELKKYWKDIYDDIIKAEENILRSLSRWHPDYLKLKGIEPLNEYYNEYLKAKKREKMYDEKNPDLIISAWGEWDTHIPGVIRVATADNKEYLIKKNGYDQMSLKLLSNCEIVKQL